MTMRLYMRLSPESQERRIKHFFGFPPELSLGTDGRQEMGQASFLIIETKSDGVFLYRFAENGTFVGDTWHRDVDEAKLQAATEYEASTDAWESIPDDVKD